MLIRANRDTFMLALSKAGGVVEKRQTLPILGNFLVSANGESVQITGTDLEAEIRTQTDAEVDRPGETTLPARKLIDICRALPDDVEVSLKIENDRGLLVAGKSRFTLGTLPATDFPTMESNVESESIELPEAKLKYLLEMTGFAMAHQDVRYYLNGLLLEVRADRVVAVATDGHRMAKVEQLLPLGIEREIQIILPRKTVLELARLLGADPDESVRLDVSEKVFRAFVRDTVLTSKLIDGRYPDYERVVPANAERVAYVQRDALKQALLRTSILSNEKYRGVRFSLNQGQLMLQAHNPEQEEAEEEMDVVYSQEPTVIGFNVGYLMDVLNVLQGGDVEIAFKDSDSSAILRNKGKDEETFVVMPMRL